MKTFAMILAAGKGTRMKSELPKVLHPIGGIPMVEHLVNKLETMDMDEIIVVIGYKGELIQQSLGSRVSYVEQREQLGTAHAVDQARSLLQDRQGATLVITGDTPLIKTGTIENLIKVQRETQSAGVVLTTLQQNPTGYGRILRDKQTRKIYGIVEEKDATAEQKKIHEVNTGIFCFDNQCLFQALPYIKNHNAQKEFYLTDIIEAMKKIEMIKHRRFESVLLEDPKEVMGINNPDQLQEAEKVLQDRMKVLYEARR